MITAVLLAILTSGSRPHSDKGLLICSCDRTTGRCGVTLWIACHGVGLGNGSLQWIWKELYGIMCTAETMYRGDPTIVFASRSVGARVVFGRRSLPDYLKTNCI